MNAALDLENAAELFRVLGHGVRLRLLTALIDGERAVGGLETVSGVGQPMLSQQLGVLRKAGLVETRREAKQVFYRLNHDRIQDISAIVARFSSIVSGQTRSPGQYRRGGSAAMFARMD